MTAKTTRILKEARLLFWPWCALIAAGMLPLARPMGSIYLIGPLAFVLGIPLLAALPLGNEFQHRTLSLLLSQPIDRMEMWREKLSVTAIAVLSAVLVCSVSLWAAGDQIWRPNPVSIGAWIVAAVASATFWTLFTRSTLGSVAMTIAVQGFIVLAGLMVYRPSWGVTPVLAVVLLLCYAGVTLWLGRRMLARYQATGVAAGDDLLIAGPDVMPGVLAGWLRCRPTGVIFNLIRKEIRLLRPVWLATILAALGWTCVTLVWYLHHGAATRISDTTVISVVVTCTLLISILAGSSSLGEERSSGTHAWHLTLPVPALLQWGVKLSMALGAGVVVVWLLPLLMVVGRSLFISPNPMVGRGNFGINVLVVVLILTFTAFWCACAVKGTVHAVLWVFPVIIALYYAGKLGKWAGLGLTHLFFAGFDPFANVAFSHTVSRLGSNAFFKLIQAASNNMTDSVQAALVLNAMLLVPTLLYAVIQSYRLFRAEARERAWSVVRSLVPLALTAFLCNIFIFAVYTFAGQARDQKMVALFETIQAFQKIQPRAPKLDAAHPLQLTVEDLAKASTLSKSTRRLLGNSHITLSLEEPPHQGHFGCAENPQPRGLLALRYPWYSAIVPLADGSRFFVVFEPGAHSFISAGFCK
jgi:hypothetical protein